jgi:cytosine/adenosine deaminase-related metal-dependent hydrolase
MLGIPAGLIAPGNYFDAFVVKVSDSMSGMHMYDGVDDETRLFEKIVRLAGPADITRVWVGGKQVVSA